MPDSAVKFVPTSFGRLAYRESGSGRSLLLNQRYRATMDDWEPDLIAKLASRRRVIWFDSAGVGRSEGQAPRTVAGMAEVAVAFLDALGEGQVDVLGWSLGGFVAQQLALDHPQRVRRLIIAASGCGGVPEAPARDPRVARYLGTDGPIEERLMFLFFTESDAAQAAGRRHLRKILDHPHRGPDVSNATGSRQWMAISAFLKTGVRSRLRELHLPVLVANGSHDRMIQTYQSYVISQEAPHAKLILYPDAGHGFLVQHHDQFASDVNAFLGEAS